jgi:type 1 glutamine amidotransferase
MRLFRFAMALGLAVAMTGALSAQPRKKKLLAIGESQGWQHDAMSYGLGTVWQLGKESGLWDTYIRTDTQLITKKKLTANAKNLDFFDAVFLYTSGELPLDPQQKADFISFLREDGKGLIGAHSATDTLFEWEEYGEIIGGYFDGHPWNQFQAPIIVEDRDFPATRHFPREFTILDEIYQAKNFSRDRVRVLMSMDASKIDLQKKGVKRTDGDFAVAWARNYGKGRVFYSTFGHREEVWDRPDIRTMWLEAIKWAMGMTAGDATPRPKPAERVSGGSR